MKKLKNQKGAITMIVLITIVFMLSFLMTSYILIANKVRTQKEMLAEIKDIYKPKSSMEEIYNSFTTVDNVIPIYTVNQLLAIGSNQTINIYGKVYTFSYSQNYLLKNDLEFSAIELGLGTDWMPLYRNTDFTGNFDWSGHTIKVTTLTGNTITYDGTYTDTINGYPTTFKNAIKSDLVNYKIYGNSIQNGQPSPTNPVEIQSVGNLVTDEADSNYGKYKIPVKVSNGIDETTTNIYLDEPLRKVGNYADYIDFEEQKVFRYCRAISANVSDMNNSEEYPGWRGLGVREDYPDINGGLNSFTKQINNIGYSTVNINTLGSNDILFLYTYINGGHTTQSELKEKYPNLVFNLLYGLNNPIEETIDLPNIPLYKGKNTITVDTQIAPSNMTITYNAKQ